MSAEPRARHPAVTVAELATWPLRALVAAAAGPVTDRVARAVVELRLAERVAAEILAAETLERVIRIADETDVGNRLIDAVLENGGAERIVDHLLAHGELDRILERVLASDEVHLVVQEIARSEEVRLALQAQSAGLVDDVADQVRDRTARTDDVLERVARRLLRRPPAAAPLLELPPEE